MVVVSGGTKWLSVAEESKIIGGIAKIQNFKIIKEVDKFSQPLVIF